MNKILAVLVVLAFLGYSAFGQKVINDANAEKRTVGSFHGIDVGTGIDLILTEAGSEEVAVSAATPEFRDKIVTKVENGILKLYYENKLGAINKKKEHKELKAYVSYKSLDRINATTGASVKINGVLKAPKLDMEANTGAIIEAEINVPNLTVTQTTGSRVTLTGTSDKLVIEGNTGSKFKGEDLATSNCNVSVNTGAIVSVKADKELQVNASTGGNVKYKGNATIKEIKTHTGGSVTKI